MEFKTVAEFRAKIKEALDEAWKKYADEGNEEFNVVIHRGNQKFYLFAADNGKSEE